jgi:folylpolyglutamate synthase/dihydropteroate synthase
VLVFAAMRGKHLRGIYERAVRTAATILVTAPQWYRARSPHEVAARISATARRDGVPTQVLAPGTVRETLEMARRLAAPRHRSSVLVTGSNFLVAEALDRLGVDDLAATPSSVLWDEGRPLRRRNFSKARAVS